MFGQKSQILKVKNLDLNQKIRFKTSMIVDDLKIRFKTEEMFFLV